MFYNPKIVIKRIKELQGDESENSMAKRLGISQVTLNYCLSGKRKPSLDLVYRICDIYGSSIDWLLGLTDQRSPFIEAPRENKVSKTPEIREKFPSFGSPVCRSVRQYYKDTTNGAEKQERKDQEDDAERKADLHEAGERQAVQSCD